MPDAVELLLPGGAGSKVWMCPECRTLVSRCYQPVGDGNGKSYTPEERDEFARRSAGRCCEEAKCPCGNGLGHKNKQGGWTKCGDCRHRDEQDREQKRFDKATKLSEAEWDGPVWTPGDKFFMSLEDFHDHYLDSEPDDFVRPEYVWCSKPVKWQPDLSGYVMDQVSDNFHEDAADQIDAAALKELDDFGEAWWATHSVQSFEVDYSKCVLIESPLPAGNIDAA